MDPAGFFIYYKDPHYGYSADPQNPQSPIKKNLPYLHYDGPDDLENRNCKVHFKAKEGAGTGSDELVTCRHLALFLGLASLGQEDGKVPLSKVSSDKAIKQHVKRDTQEAYRNLLAHADRVHAFNNRDFAEFLKSQFEQMEIEHVEAAPSPPEEGQTGSNFSNGESKYTSKGVKTFMILAIQHAMLLRLRLKEASGEGRPVYVVSFYDPNRTASMVRCEVSQLRELGAVADGHSLAAFINSANYAPSGEEWLDKQTETDWYDSYYRNDSAHISIALEISTEACRTPAQVKQPDRKLESCQCDLGPELLWHLMYVGLSKEILDIGAKLNAKGLMPGLELLSAKEPEGNSGLFMALQNGNADAIRAWGSLLQSLPEKQRGSLVEDLLAENWSLRRGLTMNTALEGGYADAIRAFGEILQWLPDNKRISAISNLLAGVPNSFASKPIQGLAVALENGFADAIRAWGDLLDLVPDKRCDLINKHMQPQYSGGDSPPGLIAAIKNGHVDAISAFIGVLKGFSAADRGEIIERFIDENLSGLMIENEPGAKAISWNAAVIRGVGSLLQGLPDNERRKIIKGGLLEIDHEYKPRLFGLFEEKDVETLDAWNTFLQDVLGKELGTFIQALLANNKKAGGFFLDRALELGNAGAIRLLEGWLKLLPEAERSITLQGLFADSMFLMSDVAGLTEALKFGHADAIKAWRGLLAWLPNDERIALIDTLVAQNRLAGRACLATALQYGHADAIRAFEGVLKFLPAGQRSLAVRNLLPPNSASDPMRGLGIALKNQHPDAIQAWASLLQWLPDNERALILKGVLATKHGHPPVLHLALKFGHADVIRAWGSLLEWLPDNEHGTILNDLLAAKDPQGVPGLFLALFNGNADAIQAWGSLLKWLPDNERGTILKELLAAKDPQGVSGLALALQHGHADAIRAWGSLLQYLPEKGRGTAIRDMLAARAFDGAPGLFPPLARGHSGAIVAWGELLKLLPKAWFARDIAKLILARHGNLTALDVLPASDPNKVGAAWWSLTHFISDKNLGVALSTVLHQNDFSSKTALLKALDDMKIKG